MSPVATGRVPAAPSVPSAGVPSAAVAPASTRPGPVARLVLAVLRAYRRFVSPFLPPRCRFAPSCSAYAVAAVTEHGLVRGGWLALRRLARCHPFHPGGVDPVPPAKRANRC